MSDKQMVSVPLRLNEQQSRDVQRFYDTCEDGQGYDVPKDRMKTLARIGLARSLGFGRYELTDAGDAAVNGLRDKPRQPTEQHKGEPVEDCETFEYQLDMLGSIDRCNVSCGSYGDKYHRWDDAGPYVEYEDHVKHIELYKREVERLSKLYTRPAQGEAAMWANVLGDTITDKVKNHNLSLGGAPAKIAESYTQPLYTHADPAEVERLRDENRRLHEAGEFLDGVNQGIEDKLRAQLAERDALLRGAAHLADRLHKSSLGMRRQALAELLAFLSDASASAEPSAPVEHDDATLIDALRTCEKWFIKHSPTAPLIGGLGDAEHPMLTCIRAALTLKQ